MGVGSCCFYIYFWNVNQIQKGQLLRNSGAVLKQKISLFCSQTLNSETVESQTGCRSVEPTLCWALFRKLASPSLHHHQHYHLTIIINKNIITSAIIIHTYAHMDVQYISASALPQILYNSQKIGTCIFTHCSLCSAPFTFLLWVSDLL